MFRHLLLLSLGLLLWLVAISQTVTGSVVSTVDSQPIVGASVFFTNTSIGTVTAANGGFSFAQLPPGTFDLVVSCLGYETYVQSVNTAASNVAINIKLAPKATELASVVVEPYEKDNWERWGQFFIENFVGVSEFADRCGFKNPKSLQFRRYKKSNRLVVFASAPLVFENRYLGYRISYQLEQFEYNFIEKTLFFQGYTLFSDIKKEPKPKIEARRNEAYQGSVMHFMRSFYRNRLTDEGFELRTIKRLPNLDKQRVKRIYAGAMAQQKSPSNNTFAITLPQDSSAYYNKVLRQPDFSEVLYNTPLPADSVGFALADDLAGLRFSDVLEVTYLNKPEPLAYAKSQGRKPNAIVRARLQLINSARYVAVQQNGNYANPTDLLLGDYWAFSEKVATMLPFDFVPQRK